MLLTAPLYAQQVTIHGMAPAYIHKEIMAFSYQDYITWTRTIVDTDTITPTGQFTLHLEVKVPGRIYLFCDHLKTPLYVEPGRSYDVEFPHKDSSRLLNGNVEQDGEIILHPVFGNVIDVVDTTELNWLINDFNVRYEQFWKQNYRAFVVKMMQAPLDSFGRAMKNHYARTNNAYFQTYIEYSIASIKVSTLESQNYIAKEYLTKRKIEYSNYEYMTFFNQFFDKYFYQFCLKPKGAPVFAAINDRGDAEEVMKVLSQAPYLINDTLRELLLLKGLNENFNNKDFNSQRIFQMLDEISKKSKIPDHRQIARNTIARFTTLRRGTMAPAFTLTDHTGKTVSLSDFKGRYVYLTFGKSKSPSCLTDLKALQETEKKYPFIQVITIMNDDKSEDMKLLLKQNPKFKWTFLQAGGNELLKHAYNIYSEPYYYLIGPTGKLLLSPAPGPYDGADELFYLVTKNKDGKFRVGE
jgi:peroxiredoxin